MRGKECINDVCNSVGFLKKDSLVAWLPAIYGTSCKNWYKNTYVGY